MNSSGKWVLWVVLIAAAVALVVFAPKRPELAQIVDAAPWHSALPASAPSASGARVPSPNESSTGPSAATDAAPPASAPPGSPPPLASASVPDTANAARIELAFPSQAAIGSTIDIVASLGVGTAANRAEVVVQFDPSALQLLSAGSGEPGRAEATIQNAIDGRELGVASFQFQVVAREPQATVVTTTATAFDANGGAVKVAVPPPQKIALE